MKLSVFAAAQERPAELALIADRERVSYAELAARCAGIAAALQQRGLVGGSQALGVVVRPTLRSLELIQALIALRTPMLLIHPALPASERSALAARAGVRAVLAPDEESIAVAAHAPVLPDPNDDISSPLAIVPTSGSSGTPKLVVLSRAAFVASAEASARNLPLSPEDRWLLCLPPAHVGGLSIVTRCLLSQSTVVAFDAPNGLTRALPELANRISEYQVSVLSLVPAVLDALLTQLPEWRAPSSLRAVLVGGAALSPALLERSRARNVPVLTTYGLTEACSQVTTTALGTWPRTRDGVVSSGVALSGVELRIGAGSRILVRSPALCSSYWDTPAAFDDEGWFATEDRGYLDEHGELYVLGRISELIVTGGENVDPLRVESALLAAPGVLGAVVFGVPDARFGEIVACALITDEEFDAPRVSAHLRKQLSRHELPRRLARLPMFATLANGKIDRVRIRAQSAALLETFEHVRS